MLRFSTATLERRYAQETHERNCERDLVCFRTWILMHVVGFVVVVAHFIADRCVDSGRHWEFHVCMPHLLLRKGWPVAS